MYFVSASRVIATIPAISQAIVPIAIRITTDLIGDFSDMGL
jgi:hypothetical protein